MERFESRWLVMVVVATVFVVLVPSGVGGQDAQSESSESKPGPCEDGWVAPTPVNVAVTGVPIRVASSVDDYFVLYVRDQPVVEDVVWDFPVLVKRGESGTTTLSDNLAPLAAERYRVEKYSVADPGDLDGDCVDDIAELNQLGLRNPFGKVDSLQPVNGVVTITDRATFKRLAYKGLNTISEDDKANIEYIKFHICGFYSRFPSFHFQNTNRFKIHMTVFSYEPAALRECRGFTIKTGVLAYHPNVVAPDGSLGVYRYDFEQRWESSFKEVAYVNERLAAVLPFVKNKLAYYPVGSGSKQKYEEQKSLYDASRVNVLLADDIVPDVGYVSYHEAEGYGLLRVVESEEMPGPRDVAILKVLPNDLPRVAGVITTVPQTPLSHVNLRAIQNDVPNAFIRDVLSEDDADLDISDLVGNYVYFKVSADGYTLRAASKAEVDAHYNASRPSAVQTPTRDLTVKKITALSNVSFGDWDSFGVKAANMAELSKLSSLAAGVVPSGFAVPFYFYDEFMKANDLYGEVKKLLADEDFQSDFGEQEKELKKLRKKIKKATTPAWIITALETMHDSYPDGTSLRYRSSTNNEDLPDFSGAGLYDSKTQDPDETAEDGIDKSIKAVWASLWNFRAFVEREHHRVDHLATAMGVLVHPNYSDELANGVAVSYDPIRGTPGTFYVNTQLGEDLVTNPEANSLPEELLLAADGARTVLAYSNLADSGKLFMTDAQITQLRSSLAAIHDRFAVLYGVTEGDDFAMEIEFKITADNKLAIKQARPWVFSEPLTAAVVDPALAQLIADVRGYAAEIDNGEAHVRRWKRVLLALGELVPGFNGTPMTVAEAQIHAQTYWSVRWDPIAEALQTIENLQLSLLPTVSVSAGSDVIEGSSASFTVSASPALTTNLDVTVDVTVSGDFGVTAGTRIVTVPTSGSATLTVDTVGDSTDEADGSVTVSVTDDTAYDVDSSAGSATVDVADDDDPPTYVVPASLVSDVQGYAAETIEGDAHVTRWKRVLLAFGESVPGFSDTPMTATEAQTHADKGWSRWDPVVTALQSLAANPQQQTPAVPTVPTVSIAAGSDVTEGSAASFTVSASPAPSADLTVTVNVTALGSFGVTTGSRTVTVPTTGSVALTVATTGDSIDEPHGSVTVAVADDTAYDVSSTAGTATVVVSNEDDPPPTPPPTPVVSVAAGSDVAEGSSALFTVTASPAPTAPLTVTVNVTASGSFGVTAGSRTVTVGASGSAILSVATTGDSTDEPNGSVTVTVTDDTGYDVHSTAGTATVAISDDDDPPPPADLAVLSVGDVVVGEGEWFALLTVRLSKPAEQEVTFGYATAITGFGAGHASLGADFKPVGRSGTISKGSTKFWLSVTVRDDSRDEPDETLKIVLSDLKGAVLGDGQAIITIKDND